jgi:hypothetical protein
MKSRDIILCIDFDGTIVEHDFPRVGKPMPLAIEVIKELKEAGYVLILWTCREGKFLDDAIMFCLENGLKFDGYNETPPEHEFRPEGGRKAYGDYYIDDRNLGGFPGWEAVRMELLNVYKDSRTNKKQDTDS